MAFLEVAESWGLWLPSLEKIVSAFPVSFLAYLSLPVYSLASLVCSSSTLASVVSVSLLVGSDVGFPVVQRVR